MQSKIADRKDFENEIFNDPINLLQVIKEHSLAYQEPRYEISIMLDSIPVFSNSKLNKKKNFLRLHMKV